MSRFFSTTDQARWSKLDHQTHSLSCKDCKQVKVLEIGCGSGRWARSLLAEEGEEMISNVTRQYFFRFCDVWCLSFLFKTASFLERENQHTNHGTKNNHWKIICVSRACPAERPQKVSQYLGIDSSSTMADESVPETNEFHQIVSGLIC